MKKQIGVGTKGEGQEMGFAQPWRERYVSGEPLRIGNQVQLLFDDYVVEDRYGLRRVAGPVEKHPANPLEIRPDLPWESAIGLPDLLYDPEESLYKAWYCVSRHQEGIETGHIGSTAYAESRDGIVWTKPELGLFPYGGRENTNIVFHKEKGTAHMRHVWLDPRPDAPERRFTALAKMVPPGETDRCIARMFSPDGRKWELAPDPVLFRGASDGSYSLVRDPVRDGWLLYRRPPTRALRKEGFYAGANNKRHVSVCMSKDLRNWTHPRSIALPDEIDVSDVDSVKVVRYRDIFLGFIGLMDNAATLPVRTHLMFSRDGFVWERLPDRPLFVANGGPGEWDAGGVHVTSLVPDGDRIRIYYIGASVPQHEERLPHVNGTGLAFVGKDRFVGQQAGPEGGYLLTRQFMLEGDSLEINCRSQVERPPTADMGALLKAELLQPPVEHYEAQPYPGYSRDECEAIAVTDERERGVRWNGSPDLSPLRGRRVYIRFYVRNATLYTFRIGSSS